MKRIILFALLMMSTATFAQNISKEIHKEENIKSQLLGAWKFHEITVITPKDGYLMRISERETGMLNLLVANYTFNKDGSVTLDPKYMEKQGVKSAIWKLDNDGVLSTTYFWTAEKQKSAGYSNDYERIDYRVSITPNKNLSLNLQDMFIVKLVRK